MDKPNKYEEWKLGGKLHRENGPAVIWTDGDEAVHLLCVSNN